MAKLSSVNLDQRKADMYEKIKDRFIEKGKSKKTPDGYVLIRTRAPLYKLTREETESLCVSVPEGMKTPKFDPFLHRLLITDIRFTAPLNTSWYVEKKYFESLPKRLLKYIWIENKGAVSLKDAVFQTDPKDPRIKREHAAVEVKDEGVSATGASKADK